MRLFAADAHTVALFGSGLIGAAIAASLRSRAAWRIQPLPYSWTEQARRRAELAAIVERAAAASGRCDVIWAAGVSGFGSSSEQMDQEVALVAELCAAAERLTCAGLEVVFHLVSSGGGLFEGQTQVGRDTRPAPLRPYGVGKLQQEQMLLARPHLRARIYRPSSAYGFQPGGRRGLFATLMLNAMANRPTLISGSERTLRDYVSASDLGNFIAGKAVGPVGEAETWALASGKPTSMFEVIALIEARMDRPLYRRFEPKASNALDLSFAPSSLPADWTSTPLAVGLAALHVQIQTEVIRRGRPAIR